MHVAPAPDRAARHPAGGALAAASRLRCRLALVHFSTGIALHPVLGLALQNDAMTLPDHYCQLAPFAAAFGQGTPALLYHRLGRAPLFTRQRGLTLPTRVFTRQLAELKAAGFKSADIWLTFDDGDASTLAALEPLRTHGFQAI